jgi:hypothetical protein
VQGRTYRPDLPGMGFGVRGQQSHRVHNGIGGHVIHEERYRVTLGVDVDVRQRGR